MTQGINLLVCKQNLATNQQFLLLDAGGGGRERIDDPQGYFPFWIQFFCVENFAYILPCGVLKCANLCM